MKAALDFDPVTVTLDGPGVLAGCTVEVTGIDAVPVCALDCNGNDVTARVVHAYRMLATVRGRLKVAADDERGHLYIAQFSRTEQNAKGQR